MLDPDNSEFVEARAEAEGRSFSDQLNWGIKKYRQAEECFEGPQIRESSA